MKIAVKNVEPIVLEFADGTQKKLILNNSALINIADEFGDLQKLFSKDSELSKNPIKMLAVLLYGGIKVSDPAFTYQEAEFIALNGGYDMLVGITEHLFEVLGTYNVDEIDKDLKKKLEKTYKSLLKNKE